ncbi:MAG: hypothetical protein RLZZ46_1031, partial [Bacteroidota bacterium]
MVDWRFSANPNVTLPEYATHRSNFRVAIVSAIILR